MLSRLPLFGLTSIYLDVNEVHGCQLTAADYTYGELASAGRMCAVFQLLQDSKNKFMRASSLCGHGHPQSR